MIPKIAACLHAVASGVGSAHLLDGRLPHVCCSSCSATPASAP